MYQKQTFLEDICVHVTMLAAGVWMGGVAYRGWARMLMYILGGRSLHGGGVYTRLYPGYLYESHT